MGIHWWKNLYGPHTYGLFKIVELIDNEQANP